MTTGLLFALLTGILWMLVGILYSRATADKERFVPFMALYSLAFILITWLKTIPFPHVPPENLARLAAVMLPASAAGQLGFIALCRAMRCGPHGIAWTISQAAMLLPFLFGWLILKNDVSNTQLAGMLAVLLALPLIGKMLHAPRGTTRTFLLLCFSALLLIGCGQILSQLPNTLQFATPELLAWRLPLYCLTGLWWFIPLLRLPPARRHLKPVAKPALLYALTVVAGQLAFYRANDAMSAVHAAQLVYPVAIGSCIALFFLYCRIVRHETCTRLEQTGVLLLIAGLALLAVH